MPGDLLLAVEPQHARAPEVLIADTDALLGDACDTLLYRRRSELLRAIDSGAAIAFMSSQTFDELGRVSAVAARGRNVDHATLRELIVDAYLTRIPVIEVVPGDGTNWLPDANDVKDVDDRAHVQAARLVGARAVYSHDRDLRRPGFAPATRADYDGRMLHLGSVSTRHETEQGIGLVVGLTGGGASQTVSWVSVQLKIKPLVVWIGLAIAIAALGTFVLAPPERRRRIAIACEPVVKHIGAVVADSDASRQRLAANVLVAPREVERLEVRVASHLVRRPDRNMGEIAEWLDLAANDRRRLTTMLNEHSSFEKSSRYGWSVGRLRPDLITEPPSWPGSRESPTGADSESRSTNAPRMGPTTGSLDR